MELCCFKHNTLLFFNILLVKDFCKNEILTSTPRSLVPPAPHPIGQALDVSGADAMVPGIASEDDFSSILIVGTIDDSPLAMVQREGAETGTHVDYATEERKTNKTGEKRLFSMEQTLFTLDYSD